MDSPAPGHEAAICLAKQGDGRFLGHLDLARLVERSLRRSGLPVRSSSGFNPRLKVAFTDALPVGMASEGEWLTVTLNEDLAAETIRAALEPALPKCVHIVETRRGESPRASGRVRYRLEIEGPAGSAMDALTALLACDSFPVEDPRTARIVDARALIVSAEIEDDHTVVIELAGDAGRPPRPSHVVQALDALARRSGAGVIGIGKITKLREVRPEGELPWDDADVADKDADLLAASCSSTAARAPRVG